MGLSAGSGFSKMKIKTDAIVLRDNKLESDRALTLLSRELGVITAYAGGANRIRSGLAGPTELLCYSGFVLFKHRGRYSVNSADAIRTFFGLREDVEKLALASYFAQLSGELCDRHGAPAYLRLLLNTLHFLEKGKRSPLLLKPIFELRILTMSGYMPNLVACRECAAYEADTMLFSPKSGGLLCPQCSTGHENEGTPIPPGVLAAMRHIIYCGPEKLFSYGIAGGGLALLGRVAENYLQYQLEKTLPTLEFWRALSGA